MRENLGVKIRGSDCSEAESRYDMKNCMFDRKESGVGLYDIHEACDILTSTVSLLVGIRTRSMLPSEYLIKARRYFDASLDLRYFFIMHLTLRRCCYPHCCGRRNGSLVGSSLGRGCDARPEQAFQTSNAKPRNTLLGETVGRITEFLLKNAVWPFIGIANEVLSM